MATLDNCYIAVAWRTESKTLRKYARNINKGITV